MPLDEFKLLCSDTSTGKLKKVFIFSRFSVCCLRVVSTSKVPFFNFLTDLGVPIAASICFSITKGDSEVTGLSSFFD